MNISEVIDILITIALTSGFIVAKEQYFKERDVSDTTSPQIYFANSKIEYTTQQSLCLFKTYEIQSLIFINNCLNVSSFDFDTLINTFITNIKNYCVNYEFHGLIERNKITLSSFERTGEKEGVLYFNINLNN